MGLAIFALLIAFCGGAALTAGLFQCARRLRAGRGRGVAAAILNILTAICVIFTLYMGYFLLEVLRFRF